MLAKCQPVLWELHVPECNSTMTLGLDKSIQRQVQHNYAKKKCDLIAFLNTAFYSYDENVFCGNRCYLFCTSILHDIKVKRGHEKKRENKKENTKKKKTQKINNQAVCVIHFPESNLCMPIRVEHFDIVLHAFKCSLFFPKRPL